MVQGIEIPLIHVLYKLQEYEMVHINLLSSWKLEQRW